MNEKNPEPEVEEKEGREALEEEAAAGSLAPSAELEEAMREAAEAVEARSGARRPARGGVDPAELEAARQELEQSRERLLRLQADFDNHRKRALRERHEAFQYGHENLVKDLLGTVDNLERAIDHARASEGGDLGSMLQGLELVHRELLGTLAKHGVRVIEAAGAPFDPTVHEAMAQEVDDEVPANTVVKVFQKGYQLRDRLLRPASVVVSRRSENAEGGA